MTGDRQFGSPVSVCSTMDQGIHCIIGLGNPGNKYEATRHNAGYWLVDALARRYGKNFRQEAKFFGQVCRITLDGTDCWLLKPTTFMNRSGQAVSSFASYYKITVDNMLVVHDELDLEPGTVRLKRGGGHGGHNGLRDICSAMNSKDFYRLRVGIGHPGHRDQVVDYVLSRPSIEDQRSIEQSIADALDQLQGLLRGDYQKVMNELHSN